MLPPLKYSNRNGCQFMDTEYRTKKDLSSVTVSRLFQDGTLLFALIEAYILLIYTINYECEGCITFLTRRLLTTPCPVLATSPRLVANQ